jgi:hypothetical protein
MSTRFTSIASFAALLVAAAAFSAPAQAGVSWSVGINAPIAPGVHVGTVIGGGHRHYLPAPVVYAPPVYVAPRVYAPAPVVYAPRPVYYAPRPVVYRPPVVVRPAYVRHHHHHRPHHPYQPQGRDPGRGGGGHHGPMAKVRGDVR